MSGILISLLVLSPLFLLIGLLILLFKLRRKREAREIAAGIFLRLPVWSTVKQAYALAWQYRMEFLKISWCWIAVYLVVMCALSLTPLSTDASYLLLLPFETFFASSIAVAWHRLILRNEKTHATFYLRADRTVWTYFATAIFLYLIHILAAGIQAFLHESHGFLLAFLSLALTITLVVAMIRLPVILPARALSEKITFRAVWRKTRRNTSTLFWVHCLITVPIFAPVILLALFFVIPPALSAINTHSQINEVAISSAIENYGIATLALSLLTIIVFTPVYLSYLSLAYRFFFEKDEAVIPPAQAPA